MLRGSGTCRSPARDAYRRHGPTGARGADRSLLSSFAFRENLLRPVESRLAVLTDWVWGKGLMKPAGLASRLEWLLVPSSMKVCRTPKTGGSTGRSRRLLGYACQSASPQARPGGQRRATGELGVGPHYWLSPGLRPSLLAEPRY